MEKSTIDRFRDVYNDLKFNNLEILNTGFEILRRCIDKEFSINKTGEEEILIYTKDKEGRFYNLLIDEDNDISFLLIGIKPEEYKTEYFYSEKSFNYDYIVSLLQ